MSFTLIMNSTNVVGIYNNTYQYKFITGNFTAKDSEMAISNIVIPYSWYNITAQYGNNKLTLVFPTAATTVTLNLTFPDGFYTVNDIQNYIELQCQNNGLYLINATGAYEYYTQLSYNATYYAVQLIAFVVPNALPAGYTSPPTGIYSATGTGLPLLAQTPQFQFAATGSIAPI